MSARKPPLPLGTVTSEGIVQAVAWLGERYYFVEHEGVVKMLPADMVEGHVAKQPDRFEKLVENDRMAATLGIDALQIIRCDVAVTLLRREHAAVARAVKQMDSQELTNMSYDFQAGSHNAYMKVLAMLTKRKGGDK